MRRKHQFEDLLITACVVVIALMLLWFLTSCTTQQSVARVKYSKGCYIEVEAAENNSASNMIHEIEFRECELGRTEELRGETVKPPPDRD